MQLNKLLSHKFDDPDLMYWVADVEEYLLENHSNQFSSEKKSEIKNLIKDIRFYGYTNNFAENAFEQLKTILKRTQPEDLDNSNSQDTESDNDFKNLKQYLTKLSTLERGIEQTDLQDLEQHTQAMQSKYSEIDFITLFDAMSKLRL